MHVTTVGHDQWKQMCFKIPAFKIGSPCLSLLRKVHIHLLHTVWSKCRLQALPSSLPLPSASFSPAEWQHVQGGTMPHLSCWNSSSKGELKLLLNAISGLGIQIFMEIEWRVKCLDSLPVECHFRSAAMGYGKRFNCTWEFLALACHWVESRVLLAAVMWTVTGRDRQMRIITPYKGLKLTTTFSSCRWLCRVKSFVWYFLLSRS